MEVSGTGVKSDAEAGADAAVGSEADLAFWVDRADDEPGWMGGGGAAKTVTVGMEAGIVTFWFVVMMAGRAGVTIVPTVFSVDGCSAYAVVALAPVAGVGSAGLSSLARPAARAACGVAAAWAAMRVVVGVSAGSAVGTTELAICGAADAAEAVASPLESLASPARATVTAGAGAIGAVATETGGMGIGMIGAASVEITGSFSSALSPGAVVFDASLLVSAPGFTWLASVAGSGRFVSVA